MKIGCAILAGGKSSRMGQDKAFLKINEKTFLEELMLTLNDFEEKLISRNEDMEVPSWRIVKDVYKDHGPMGGIHACLSTCKSDALFIISCDSPLLEKSMVQSLCEVFNQNLDAVVIKEETGRVHPLCGIYKKSVINILEELLLLDNNRLMVALEKMNVEYFVVPSSQKLSNINTPEDYKKIINKN